MPKVSIIIPNWNGAEKLRRNLSEVLEAAKFSAVEEVIVTDDASADESVKILKNDYPEVVVVESKYKKNLGFASNVNVGVAAANGDFIALLNTDAVPDKNFLNSVLPHFEDNLVFSVGCNTGGFWSTGSFGNGFFWHGQADKDKEDGDKPHRTLWASGGSGVFRKSTWDELGGLDPLFNPFYEEDTDLGYRATKRGYINIWEPKSVVSHYDEVGVIAANFKEDTISRVAERNHLIFIWKNITSDKLINDHKKALARMLLLHPKYWAVFLSAAKKLPEILKKRNIEKKEAKLSDEEIFGLFAKD